MIEVIIDLDPSISISDEGEPIESAFIVYGYYDGSDRIGGHAGAAIHYSNQFYKIYNGLGVSADSAYDLNEYLYKIDKYDGICVEGIIPFH